MKRANQQAALSMEAIQHSSSDSLLTKAAEQLNLDQLELRLEEIMNHPGSVFDYQLKEGDQIIIPETSQEVRISGEILNPIGQAYEQGRGLKYYINRSGGFSERAKKGKVFVVYSSGTTQVTHTGLWRNYPTIEPGCQIIVPQRPEKTKTDNTAKWLAITSTMATLLVAITALVK